ncbi:haloacid dehalogenase type II [Staphylococcus nepalensis]|uniref:haloacid dehalogenase type II n=1 Tax=Staphylococcus nepalensis TaxID=214473 RepID=UPI003018A200
MYKAIIFDVYGTLFDMSSLKKDMVQFDDAQATSISKLWRKTQLNHMFLKQIMQRYIPFDELTKEALRYTMESHEIQYNREDVNQLFDSFLDLEYFEEVPQVVSLLNSKEIDVGILSNGNDNMLMPLIDNSELGDYINTVISVNEIKQYKPSPASYALILKYYHLNREDILFVSSNSWDVTGASNFGFDTVWVNRHNELFDFNGQTPTITVNNLNEIVNWLEIK